MTAPWWRRGVLYHIYPRSFMDANGDGVGDLRGILSRLDYLIELGVDAVWLSPIYPSPMADFGYDVCDYTSVDPVYGTLADFDALLAETHRRGLRLILDFVPNHTSDRHPWFLEARASRASPKREWYIWRDPAPGGGPPNNWLSSFGGSAWRFDPGTGQYYYHAFLESQPDLNWRNPEVRAAMGDVLRFWLDRGVDGFRVDVLWHLIKDAEFRDNPPNPSFRPGDPPHERQVMLYSADRPEVHEVIAELRRIVDEYGHGAASHGELQVSSGGRRGQDAEQRDTDAGQRDTDAGRRDTDAERVLIGEIYLPIERLVAYYGVDLRGAHLPFNFQLIETAWNARGIATLIDQYEAAVPAGAWPNWVLGNHDKPRIASRVGMPQARVAAMLLLTLRGMPTLYYGDELGMRDVPIPPALVQDSYEKNVPGLGLGRDPCRTPMQWDASPSAGFTTGRPWLQVSDDFPVVNVQSQRDDPASILSLYRALIRLRRSESALSIGTYESVAMTGDLVAYVRSCGERRFLIALNLGGEPHAVAYADAGRHARVVLSTHLDRAGERVTDSLSLRGDEGVVVALHSEQ